VLEASASSASPEVRQGDGMRTLIVGYGNTYRSDDGVGYHVVNAVARRLGRAQLTPDDDGLDTLGQEVDLVCLPQLLPELAQILGDYGRVIFVDAHTGAYEEELRCQAVETRYSPSAFTHHMKPETLLGLAEAFSVALPVATLISIRGFEFDLCVELSQATQRLAARAVDQIMQIVSDPMA